MITVGKVHGMKFCTYCGKYAQPVITFKEDNKDLIWTPCFTRGCDSDYYPEDFTEEAMERYTSHAQPTKYKKAWINDNGEIALKV